MTATLFLAPTFDPWVDAPDAGVHPDDLPDTWASEPLPVETCVYDPEDAAGDCLRACPKHLDAVDCETQR